MSRLTTDEPLQNKEVPTPGSWRTYVARVITEIFAPWVLVIVLFLAVGWRSGLSGLGWSLLGAAVTSIGPMIVIIKGVIAGRYTDHHLTTREHRIMPLLISAILITAGIGILHAVDAPSDVVAVEVAMLGALLVMGPITAMWKISFHTGVAGATVTILSIIYGLGLIALLVIVALIGWSRVTLRHHTAFQVIAGPPVGVFATTVPFLLVR